MQKRFVSLQRNLSGGDVYAKKVMEAEVKLHGELNVKKTNVKERIEYTLCSSWGNRNQRKWKVVEGSRVSQTSVEEIVQRIREAKETILPISRQLSKSVNQAKEYIPFVFTRRCYSVPSSISQSISTFTTTSPSSYWLNRSIYLEVSRLLVLSIFEQLI